MHEAQSWRELLGKIITESREKQRILDELKITSITLTRWINGDSEPRPQNLRHLLSILPLHREQLRTLLREEKGLKDFLHTTPESTAKDIPGEFYARILQARATTNEHLRFWTMCHLILQQALGQLDGERKGLCLWIVCCMPPSGPSHKVRSLREYIGLGTDPWGGNLEQNALFLGAESLAGHVITSYRPGIIQNIEEVSSIAPAARVKYEKSAAIYPILYAGKIAGVLLVSSTQPYYFLSKARTELIQHYADLTALAFEPTQFYTAEEIALGVMPSQEVQEISFRNFQRMIAETMVHAAARQKPVNSLQADILVWQQLEESLLKFPSETDC